MNDFIISVAVNVGKILLQQIPRQTKVPMKKLFLSLVSVNTNQSALLQTVIFFY